MMRISWPACTAKGTKELIAIVDGVRESELSWKEFLLNLKSRGLEEAPELAIGDGTLGFWKALRQVFPATREQRCTVHKTANVLNKLPKTLQPQAKRTRGVFIMNDSVMIHR
ncbi:MAG: putative transposase [Porticoccaceae bacterium]|jgi:putative transposase